MAALVLLDLGYDDILFVPAMALLLPGIAAGIAYAGLHRRSGPTTSDDEVAARSMRPRAPVLVAALALGAAAVACMVGAVLVAMFGGGGR